MIDPLDDSTVITAAAAGVTVEHAPTPRQLPLIEARRRLHRA